MKVIYRVNNNLSFELDGSGQKDMFEQLAMVQEIFGQDVCGKCKSENLVYRIRENDGNKFYELMCKKCFAVLSFGQHKIGGTLFPSKKDKGGDWLPDNGWTKWNKEKQIRE